MDNPGNFSTVAWRFEPYDEKTKLENPALRMQPAIV
jgi:hypothetical protein